MVAIFFYSLSLFFLGSAFGILLFVRKFWHPIKELLDLYGSMVSSQEDRIKYINIRLDEITKRADMWHTLLRTHTESHWSWVKDIRSQITELGLELNKENNGISKSE